MDYLSLMIIRHPDVFSDDKFKKFQVQDTENELISFVYSLAEDLDGNIWVGTDQGPLIYFNPEIYSIVI